VALTPAALGQRIAQLEAQIGDRCFTARRDGCR
jgi:DNA-binding transcriptional LysR family regulator